MNQEEAWTDFKLKHPKMVEETLGEQVNKVFLTITKSGILGRFGANAQAIQNFETLTEIFTRKAFDAGWNAREQENPTKETTKGETK